MTKEEVRKIMSAIAKSTAPILNSLDRRIKMLEDSASSRALAERLDALKQLTESQFKFAFSKISDHDRQHAGHSRHLGNLESKVKKLRGD